MRADDQHLPGGWCLTDIGSLGNYLNGRGFKKGEWSEDGRPIIRIQNLTGSSEKFNFFEGQVDTKHEVEPGDLLMSWAATLGAFIWRGPSAVLNQHIFKVDSFIVRSFHYYVLLWALDALYRKAHGSGMVHVTKGKFEGTPVLLPPLQEQHRIVEVLESYLTRLDDAMATLERAQRNLKRYRASVLKAAVEGRLVPTEAELARKEGRVYEPASVLLERILAERRRRWEEAELAKMKAKGKVPKNDTWKAKYVEPAAPDTSELLELPEGWCWVSPAQFFSWSSGDFLPKKAQKTGVYPVFGGNGVNGFHDTPLFNSPTLVIGRVGANCGNVHLTEGPSWITDNAIYASEGSDLVVLPYWHFVISMNNLNANAGGTGQPYVNQRHLNDLLIPLAPEAEQVRIVKELERLDSIAIRISLDERSTVTRIRRLRQSILKWAFEGRLVDQDLNDEPAEVLLERIRAERTAAKGRKQPRTRRVNTRSASA